MSLDAKIRQETQGQHQLQNIAEHTKELQDIQQIKETLANAQSPTPYEGDWDASTNTPDLATLNLAKGKALLVTKTGTQSIGGVQIAAEAGDFVISKAPGWTVQKGGGIALAKALALEARADVLEGQTSTLNVQYVRTDLIKPSSTSAYEVFGNTNEASQQSVIQSWFLAKTAKVFTQLSVFVYKNSDFGAFANPLNIQLWHRTGGQDYRILETNIQPAALANFNTKGIIGSFTNYELTLDLPKPLRVAKDDVYFVAMQCVDRMNPVFGIPNALTSGADWNNSTDTTAATQCWRSWQATGSKTFTGIPAFPGQNLNYNAVHFYGRSQYSARLKTIEENLASTQAAIPTVTVQQSKNAYDKDTMLVTGKGIGNDGVIFNSADYRSAMGVPVTAGRSYVISGCHALRGLRFEKADGTTVTPDSIIGVIANGTAFTPPAGCVRISFQIASNPAANVDQVQVELGTVATPFVKYQKLVNQVNGVGIQADALSATATLAGEPIAQQKDLNSLSTQVSTNLTDLQLLQTQANAIQTALSKTTRTTVIQPSPVLGYSVFGNTNTALQQAVIETWMKAKAPRRFNQVGVFLYKNTAFGGFTQPVNVQVWTKRGEVSSRVLNVDIPVASLAKFNTNNIVGSYANYELLLNLPQTVSLEVDDIYFVSIQSPDKLSPIYGDPNALAAGMDWNNSEGTAVGTMCWRNWLSSGSKFYANVPAFPTTQNQNYNVVHFYQVDVAFYDIPGLDTKLSGLDTKVQALDASKVTVTTAQKTGKNKYNKATMLVTGKGIGNDGVIFNSANYRSAMGVPVTAGKSYVISGCHALRGLRFEKVDGTTVTPDSIIGVIANGTAFTPPAGCVRISFQIASNPAANVDQVQVELGTVATPFEAYMATEYVDTINGKPVAGQVASEEPEKLDFEVLAPAVVYVPNPSIIPAGSASDFNAFNARKEGVMLYLQHFIRERVDIFLEQGMHFFPVARTAANATTLVQETLKLLIGGGAYKTKTLNISVQYIDTAILANTLVILGHIGDSMTAFRFLNGVNAGPGAPWFAPAAIARRNAADSGLPYRYLTVGHNHVLSSTIVHKGQTYTLKGCANGYGGWATSTWLRHPFRMWVFNNAGAWDLLGLKAQTGSDWSDTPANRLLITKTCYGANAPVMSANSYDLLVKEGQFTTAQVAAMGSVWTGSQAQIDAFQAWIASVATNPQNKYFDLSKTGTNRFSLAKYQERMRSLAPDGVTRLELGSTAGTWYTRVEDINRYDVCAPTHKLITTGENDRLFITNYVAIADDVIELMTECTTQDAALQVGYALYDIPGTMFPERTPLYKGQQQASHHAAKWDLYKEISSRFGTLESQKAGRKYLIPAWHVGNPLSHSNTTFITDEGNPGQTIQVGNVDDYNHVGYLHNMSVAALIYAWIAYTKVP